MMSQCKDRKRKRVNSFFQENKKIKMENPPQLHEVIIDPMESPVLPPDNKRYDQVYIIEKINDYFRMCGHELIKDDGQCFGMSVLWLLKMADGNIDWFYRIRDAIIMFPLSRFEIINDDVEKFAKLINEAQTFQNLRRNLSNDNIKKITFRGTARELRLYFHNMRSVIMFEIGGYEHSVAIYQSDGVYHLFDSNFDDGEARIIDDHNVLPKELINCFFNTFGDPVPEILNFEINQIRDPKAIRYVAPPINECDDHVRHEDSTVDMESDDEKSSFSICGIM